MSSNNGPACDRRGADLFAQVLQEEGVQYVFGNPGTTELPLLDALATSDINYVLGLQEASVVAMADGYAQASGRPGIANLHTAGGLGHAIGMILNARAANTPLVITAGQQHTRHGVTDPLLHGDLVSIARPNVKWAEEVQHPDHIPMLLRRALQDCQSAPAGPVFLSLPIDIMERSAVVDAGRSRTIERRAVAHGIPALAEALANVPIGRLVVVAGEEVFASRAETETVMLAETLGAPVFASSWPGHIPFPTNHPLWQGTLPPRASDIHALFERFDAVLLLGGHSLIAYTFSEGPAVPVNCSLFQLTGDPHQLGRIHDTALGIAGDLKLSLRAMLPILSERLTSRGVVVTDRLATATRDRDARRQALAERAAQEFAAPGISPFVAAHEVLRVVGPDVPVVDEAAVTRHHVRACLNSSSARQYQFNRSAILGWGMPAAVGTSLGLNRAPVLCLVGDGAALYSPQALWSAAHERLPVTFVVMNNREYNILKKYALTQPHYRGLGPNRFVGMDISDPAIDFLSLANSMGVPARRITRAADIASAVEDGLASGGPNLIELSVSNDP
jgi:benzoylformate decarboxylase